MKTTSSTFAERLRAALGQDADATTRTSTDTDTDTSTVATSQGQASTGGAMREATRRRPQDFAERLRRALDRV